MFTKLNQDLRRILTGVSTSTLNSYIDTLPLSCMKVDGHFDFIGRLVELNSYARMQKNVLYSIIGLFTKCTVLPNTCIPHFSLNHQIFMLKAVGTCLYVST